MAQGPGPFTFSRPRGSFKGRQRHYLHCKHENGTKGAVVHHEAFGGIICPVAALARRIANVQAGPAEGPLNRAYHLSGKVTRVSDRDIGIAV
jgi:hypothetical protein